MIYFIIYSDYIIWYSSFTEIWMTCLQRRKIFPKTPRVTGILIIFHQRGKSFFWGLCYCNLDNLSLTNKDILLGAACYRNLDNLSLKRKELFWGAFRVLYTPIIFFGTTTSGDNHSCWSEQISLYNFALPKKQSYHYCCYATSSNLLITFLNCNIMTSNKNKNMYTDLTIKANNNGNDGGGEDFSEDSGGA